MIYPQNVRVLERVLWASQKVAAPSFCVSAPSRRESLSHLWRRVHVTPACPDPQRCHTSAQTTHKYNVVYTGPSIWPSHLVLSRPPGWAPSQPARPRCGSLLQGPQFSPALTPTPSQSSSSAPARAWAPSLGCRLPHCLALELPWASLSPLPAFGTVLD